MGVNEIDGGLFVAVLNDFVEGEMKSPLFGGGAKCTAFSSVRACFGLSSRALTRSAPTCFVHKTASYRENFRAFLSKATAHIAPVEIKTA